MAKYKHTMYQTTLYDYVLYPTIEGSSSGPAPPVTDESHGDVSSTGFLGRFGVASRDN